ncbi:MAG: hypothetical protein E6K14_06425 [Methanobacteriota archaeon]|nr:MAG: hypothetical protein E6K14_06425 [Euryarchaeota archaeon]
MLWREIPDRDRVRRLMDDPGGFLDHMDAAKVERACLINYVAPEVMGFTEAVNGFVAGFAKADRKRLIPFGSVHPKRTKNAKRDVERLASKLEMAGMKIHPPHQLFAANAYVDGRLPALRTIYKTAEQIGMPVMVHTGTSIFPGARSKYGNPIDLDDVAQDFPDLTILMAHGGRPLWCVEEIRDKVLFGSDWPAPGIPGIRENLDAIRALPLSPATREAILVKNAERILA